MVLIIDNYDSFVYNLARYVRELGYDAEVVRNDAIDIQTIVQLNPSHLILSPGPCTPNEAGITLEIIRHLMHAIPILGVCLGHQAIGQALGGKVVRAHKPMHGKSDWVYHRQQGIFADLPSPLKVARYHSLIVDKDSLPASLRLTGWTDQHEIMAFEHVQYPLYGVQFHPESILTECGYTMLSTFLKTVSCCPDREVPQACESLVLG